MIRLGLLRRGRLFWATALTLALSGAASAAPGGFTAVTLQRHTAGTFYVDGAIRGYGELRMLVDTGSSYLVIGQAILDRLRASGAATYSRDLEGVMADGSVRVIPVYRVGALRLGADCWVHDVEAAIFPGSTRPILGMNILAQLAPFTSSAEPPSLGVQRCQAPQLEARPGAADFGPVEAAVGVPH
jgi:predicted aspartyl protease